MMSSKNMLLGFNKFYFIMYKFLQKKCQLTIIKYFYSFYIFFLKLSKRRIQKFFAYDIMESMHLLWELYDCQQLSFLKNNAHNRFFNFFNIALLFFFETTFCDCFFFWD